MHAIDKIRAYLEARGMSWREFSKLSGIATQTLQDMRNHRRISLDQAVKVAEVLGVTLDYLIHGKQYPPTGDDVARGVYLEGWEAEILALARKLGPERAQNRLMGLKDDDPAGSRSLDLGPLKPGTLRHGPESTPAPGDPPPARNSHPSTGTRHSGPKPKGKGQRS